MRKRTMCGTIVVSMAFAAATGIADVSKVDSRYFADESGKTFVPVGCNICFPRMYVAGSPESRAECEEKMFGWLRKFAANGGNYTRLWLGHSFFEIMPEKPGEYDAAAEATLKRTVKLCEELGIKLKLTLESFRTVLPADKVGTGQYAAFFNRPLYAPYAKNMHEFLHSEECARIYLGKARRLKELGIGDSPAVVCWELWNEINCIGPWRGDVGPWSDRMLAALHKLFPRQMTVQNLGSFSGPSIYDYYDYLGRIPLNGFMQAHRYLDPGAELDVCRGPMDVLAADAVTLHLRIGQFGIQVLRGLHVGIGDFCHLRIEDVEDEITGNQQRFERWAYPTAREVPLRAVLRRFRRVRTALALGSPIHRWQQPLVALFAIRGGREGRRSGGGAFSSVPHRDAATSHLGSEGRTYDAPVVPRQDEHMGE